MIGQTLYRLNGNPCCIFIGNTIRRFKKKKMASKKNGVYEPFSYRFSNVFVDKKNLRCHCIVDSSETVKRLYVSMSVNDYSRRCHWKKGKTTIVVDVIENVKRI